MSQTFETIDELQNMVQLLRSLSSKWVIRIIKILHDKPMPYKDIRAALGLSKNNSLLAYYVRYVKRIRIVTIDQSTKKYYLNFRGEKIYDLLESLNKIANLSITNPEDAQVKLEANFRAAETWLGPLIRHEMRKAVRELK